MDQALVTEFIDTLLAKVEKLNWKRIYAAAVKELVVFECTLFVNGIGGIGDRKIAITGKTSSNLIILSLDDAELSVVNAPEIDQPLTKLYLKVREIVVSQEQQTTQKGFVDTLEHLKKL